VLDAIWLIGITILLCSCSVIFGLSGVPAPSSQMLLKESSFFAQLNSSATHAHVAPHAAPAVVVVAAPAATDYHTFAPWSLSNVSILTWTSFISHYLIKTHIAHKSKPARSDATSVQKVVNVSLSPQPQPQPPVVVVLDVIKSKQKRVVKRILHKMSETHMSEEMKYILIEELSQWMIAERMKKK
jgi:hypothetical protein